MNDDICIFFSFTTSGIWMPSYTGRTVKWRSSNLFPAAPPRSTIRSFVGEGSDTFSFFFFRTFGGRAWIVWTYGSPFRKPIRVRGLTLTVSKNRKQTLELPQKNISRLLVEMLKSQVHDHFLVVVYLEAVSNWQHAFHWYLLRVKSETYGQSRTSFFFYFGYEIQRRLLVSKGQMNDANGYAEMPLANSWWGICLDRRSKRGRRRTLSVGGEVGLFIREPALSWRDSFGVAARFRKEHANRLEINLDF